MPVSPKPNLQLVYVSDIERSTAFYKTIFKSEPVFSSPRYVAFAATDSGKALFAIWTGGTVQMLLLVDSRRSVLCCRPTKM